MTGVPSAMMLSLLFVLGLLVGIGGALIAAAGVGIAVVTVVAWLNSLIVGARINGPSQLANPMRLAPAEAVGRELQMLERADASYVSGHRLALGEELPQARPRAAQRW
jgi:hypothetical protein